MDNEKDIKPMNESSDFPPPPLVVMSLSMRTVINPKDKTNEIVSVSTSVYHEGMNIKSRKRCLCNCVNNQLIEQVLYICVT